MNNRNLPIIIVVIAMIGLAIIIQFFVLDGALQYEWDEYKDLHSEQPYGYDLFYQLIEEATDEMVYQNYGSLVDTLPIKQDTMNYLFMNHRSFYDSADIERLMNFVQVGNKAFLMLDDIPWWLRTELGLNYYNVDQYYYDSTKLVEVNFADSGLRRDSAYTYSVLYADTPTIGYWNYFNYETFYDSMMVYDYAEPIGTIEGGVNFASFKIGKGIMYIHLQQRLFANVYITQPDGFDYVSKAISVLDDKPIIIDQYNARFHDFNTDVAPPPKSPLTFVFSQPSLRYAWYTIIVGLLLFILFRSKRQQRIIPIIPSVENTTIEFAKALGTLYYQSNSPKYLAAEMMRMFHTFNRRRYNIQPGKKGQTNHEEVAKKSRVSEKEIKEIYDKERKLKYNELARMNEVTPLYESLKNYYKNAR